MKDEMAQGAKDLVSGIKKIFPRSRRNSGSFSLSRTSSSSEFSAEALAMANEGDAMEASSSSSKKKERRTSFSFSGWKERRSSLSAKKKESPPPSSGPGGSTIAARGLGQYEQAATIPTPKGGSSYLQNGSYTTTPTALSRSTSHPGHFPGAATTLHSNPPALTRTTSATTPAYEQPRLQPGTSLRSAAYSSSTTAPTATTPTSSSPQFEHEIVNRGARSESFVPELPTKSQLSARSSRSSYNNLRGSSSGGSSSSSSSSNRSADAENIRINGNIVGVSSKSSSNTSTKSISSSMKKPEPQKSRFRTGSSGSAVEITSRAPAKEEKKRRTSFSFSSRHKSPSVSAAASTMVVDDVAMIVKKPHANTWDSDSDDDYEDTRRPRGLDRRSVSMDFMEQNPTHLISKIWRKLPIQARLYGRGSVDLDMQKDRNSFSRSSTAKQQAEKLGHSNYNKPPSPLPNANMFGDKHIYFSQQIVYFPSADGYIALESYDDVLVRVCRFASHDQRRTATKVQEFLERSMAFLHGTRTKHGNVVSISNEEIRMWRRLARHDWSLEEVTLVADLPESTKQEQQQAAKQKDSRSSSAATTECDSDSDDQRRRKAAAAAATNPEDEEEEEEEDLEVPKGADLRALLAVVNNCVGFGEYLFSFEEIDELVRLEFLVEEDGWI